MKINFKTIMQVNFKQYDLYLALSVAGLVVFSVIMMFSASAVMPANPNEPLYADFFNHLEKVVLGFAVMFFTAFKIDYRLYQEYAKNLYIAAVIILILVLIMGHSSHGATRWLDLKIFTIQPSEFVKLITIIFVSDFINRKKHLLQDAKTIRKLAGLIILGILLPIFLENDLGTPILISLVCIAMLFCAGISIKKLAVLIPVSFLVVIGAIVTKPHRLSRIKGYLSYIVNMDALLQAKELAPSLYQIKRSIQSLGSGGFFGKGLGNSDLKESYLPEAYTDFIFPIIGEEFGFLGSLILTTVFVVILIRGFKISKNARNTHYTYGEIFYLETTKFYGNDSRAPFGEYLALGITLLLIFQVIINLAVAAGLFPTKGLVLPFISFGGTAMITNMAMAGILLNISKTKKSR
ncbi:MAG: putative lipid II flippase FtsW [Elusimicrobiota bacterium]|jgi:cell division protein FtsW|nr:putative lipid II flippase FtsW [Elusimicrobiota bacterium]